MATLHGVLAAAPGGSGGPATEGTVPATPPGMGPFPPGAAPATPPGMAPAFPPGARSDPPEPGVAPGFGVPRLASALAPIQEAVTEPPVARVERGGRWR